MLKKTGALVVALVCALSVRAQTYFPRNGVYDDREQAYAFVNATLHPDPDTQLENATLLVKDGKIVAVGTDVSLPEGAVVTDLEGKHVYPGLIDLYSRYGMPEVKKTQRSFMSKPQMESRRKGPYGWNEAIRPETRAAEVFKPDRKAAEKYRKLGFGAVLTHHPDGIARGTAALVSLADRPAQEGVLTSEAATAFSFDKGSSTQDYPSSLMGCVALLRQTYLDADWYASTQPAARDLSLEAFAAQRSLPGLFVAESWADVLRADKIGDEFGQQYIIKTGGDDYQRLDAVAATGAALVVPLNFPKAYDVEDPLDARLVPLADLKHWELAPTNAARLVEKGVTFALTAADLEDMGAFHKHVRKAIRYGLSEADALRALTTAPARLAGATDRLGQLRKGYEANFLVTSGPLFDEKTVLYDNWVGSERYVVTEMKPSLAGRYQLRVGTLPPLELEIQGAPEKAKATVQRDTTTFKANLSVEEKLLTLYFTPDSALNDGTPVRLSGWRDRAGRNLEGQGQLADGALVTWQATYQGEASPDTAQPKPTPPVPELGTVVYPFQAYGHAEPLRAQNVLIRNVTVWTCEDHGKLENADVLISGGKIAAVGTDLPAGDAEVVDGTGKHLTPGIIDEHSHIAISRGVNEGTQAVTAEVRIGDVVNSEDVNIYRQLAGGVTAAQLLHGSANPVGGQSALVKLRWGQTPEQMKIDGADGFIKFALGENVKQSNWGDVHRVRFPQTRMGVEQVYTDAFTRARAYDEAQKAHAGLSRRERAKAKAPRRDLELEALAEILNNERFITCHSYVQSEINMLMHVAEAFGFRVNTFTHILEGYKVADKMAAHGAGGSTFADWWAYKMEVQDAIPYNAALMNKLGVMTAINSDDAEMGRRLNQEAAKTVKYGDVSEEEALKMITINPAKLLHLSDRTGSVKVGKDADLVLWDDHPLSIYARPAQTYVDGVRYFDQARDAELRAYARAERQRLVRQMIAAKERGEGTQQPKPASRHVWHCEDVRYEDHN